MIKIYEARKSSPGQSNTDARHVVCQQGHQEATEPCLHKHTKLRLHHAFIAFLISAEFLSLQRHFSINYKAIKRKTSMRP
jgi:hypothetical protein